MRRSFTLAGCLVGLVMAAVPGAVAQEQKVVEARDDNTFAPSTINVNVGDTVTFRNTGALPHTATAKDRSFDTGNLNAGESKPVTFTKAGTFDLVCIYHEAQGMVAKLVVQEAGGGTGSPSPTASPTASPGGDEEAAAPLEEKQPTEKYFPALSGALSALLILGLAAGYAKTFVLRKK